MHVGSVSNMIECKTNLMSTHYKNTKAKNHLVKNDFLKHTALPNLSYTQTLRLNYF